jgi:hypothetical protein
MGRVTEVTLLVPRGLGSRKQDLIGLKNPNDARASRSAALARSAEDERQALVLLASATMERVVGVDDEVDLDEQPSFAESVTSSSATSAKVRVPSRR